MIVARMGSGNYTGKGMKKSLSCMNSLAVPALLLVSLPPRRAQCSPDTLEEAYTSAEAPSAPFLLSRHDESQVRVGTSGDAGPDQRGYKILVGWSQSSATMSKAAVRYTEC